MMLHLILLTEMFKNKNVKEIQSEIIQLYIIFPCFGFDDTRNICH